MIEEQEARERILAAVPSARSEKVPLLEAGGRVLTDPLVASVPSPGFDCSSMDGYAVKSEDRGSLVVVGEQPAGKCRGLELHEGEAIRIFTGAPLPLGADAVVMQEYVEREELGVGEVRIRLKEPVVRGENVRLKGGDACRGQRLIEDGVRLGALQLGVLASQGVSEVAVGRRPRVAIVSTGDELVEPGGELGSGQIYNSNRYLLAELVQRAGGEVSVLLETGDTPKETAAVLERAAADADVVVVSGGVSVGDHDVVKPMLIETGWDAGFWRVKVKPGKPLLFATRKKAGRGQIAFGLPGNPVSSFVTFFLFVRPAILRWAGVRDVGVREIWVRAREGLRNSGDRPHYVRGILSSDENDGELEFCSIGLQQSHAVSGLAKCEVLARLEPDSQILAGARVRVVDLVGSVGGT